MKASIRELINSNYYELLEVTLIPGCIVKIKAKPRFGQVEIHHASLDYVNRICREQYGINIQDLSIYKY